MKYFIDINFIEGFKKPLIGKGKHFIDYLNIGIISENERRYYAINKNADLKFIWDRDGMKFIDKYNQCVFEYEQGVMQGNKGTRAENRCCDACVINKFERKISLDDVNRQTKFCYKESPLIIMFAELWHCRRNPTKENLHHFQNIVDKKQNKETSLSYKNLEEIVSIYGKNKKQIAQEIIAFIGNDNEIEFFIYNIEKRYDNYKWIVFQSLFLETKNNFPETYNDFNSVERDLRNYIYKNRSRFIPADINVPKSDDFVANYIKTFRPFPPKNNHPLAGAINDLNLYNKIQTLINS